MWNKLVAMTLPSLLLITGCSSTPSGASQSLDQSSVSQEEAPDPTESQLKAIMLDKLRVDCTSLNEFVLTPANWILTDSRNGTDEFAIYGDGGTLALDVIPDGIGGANVVIADSNFETTNTNLYYSGCQTIASAPLGTDTTNTDSGTSSQQNSVQQTGHYEQRCSQVQVPNPQWDPYAGPGVMSMKGISQFMYQQQCQQIWVSN